MHFFRATARQREAAQRIRAAYSAVPFYGSIDTMVIGGMHHPDQPNQFMDIENISENGVVENIVVISQDGIPTTIIK